MKKVLQVGDDRLEKKSEEISNVKEESVQQTIRDLIRVAEASQETGVGMSAPQIGKNIRLFIVRRVDLQKKGEKPKWEVMLNPKIIDKSNQLSTMWEGCFSVKKGKLFGPVSRPYKIDVEYIDKEGSKKVLTAEDSLSHFIQHEYDHLEGILFLKYVKNPQNLWTSEDIDEYKNRHGELPEIVD